MGILQLERGVRTLQTPRPMQKEGRRCSGAEIRLQPMEQTMVRQVVPLQPMEAHSGADPHLQPREDIISEQGDARRRL